MQTHHTEAPQKGFIALLILLIALPQISETFLAPCLPEIAKHLRVTPQFIQCATSLYFYGYAISVMFWGHLSDRLGRKPCLLLGLVIAMLGISITAIANTAFAYLIARLLMAIGMGVGSIIVLTIVRETFTEAVSRNQTFVNIGTLLAFAPAIGTYFAYHLLAHFAYSVCLLIFSGIVAAITILAKCTLRESHRGKHIQHQSFLSTARQLLRDPHVVASAACIALFFLQLFAFFINTPFLQRAIPMLSGHWYGFLGFGVALMSSLGALTGKYILRRASEQQALRYAVFFSFSMQVISLLALTSSFTTLYLLAQIFNFVGFGLALAICNSCALFRYSHIIGSAGSVFGGIYYGILASGLWLFGEFNSLHLAFVPCFFIVCLVVAGLATRWIDVSVK